MALMHEENRPMATAERAVETLPSLFTRLGDQITQLFDAKLTLLPVELKEEIKWRSWAADAPSRSDDDIAKLVARHRHHRPPTPSVATDAVKQRQADFLNRIRAADPQHQTIDRAILNEQNELGLILDRTAEMDRVPDLMRSILTQMAREFPGQDLTVLAYAPSNPPHKIGTAHLNAQTRDMSYTPAQ